ncbi:hypothetical protein F383_25050 [Gossypium arboreum]|uniref:Uncharacterized protein n=1 Tax=Gossypium arboreum TaxID=29729 RepID=A0A0B0NWU8_GOSAR|nr:hypothetical protein F383_25050 [Gossypium arboreum]
MSGASASYLISYIEATVSSGIV